jgi:hypothetical protein
MAFLDNSGDIILDAVLTDFGRVLIAKGDGSFKVVKFALGDDEINYELYQKNHVSGSAYYDLDILQTPVLEAFTNNASSMKSHLLTISRNDHLYLPILDLFDGSAMLLSSNSNSFEILVDETTIKSVAAVSDAATAVLGSGIWNGWQPGFGDNHCRVDQGLDATSISPIEGLDDDLKETSYMIQLDSRLGRLVSLTSPAAAASESFIDDDDIASYILSLGADNAYILPLGAGVSSNLRGPRGTLLQFKIAATTSLRTNNYLFTVLGSTGTYDIGSLTSGNWKFIDSTVAVIGQNTGCRIDIPIRFVKDISS